jgi:hypothetical protein
MHAAAAAVAAERERLRPSSVATSVDDTLTHALRTYGSGARAAGVVPVPVHGVWHSFLADDDDDGGDDGDAGGGDAFVFSASVPSNGQVAPPMPMATLTTAMATTTATTTTTTTTTPLTPAAAMVAPVDAGLAALTASVDGELRRVRALRGDDTAGNSAPCLPVSGTNRMRDTRDGGVVETFANDVVAVALNLTAESVALASLAAESTQTPTSLAQLAARFGISLPSSIGDDDDGDDDGDNVDGTSHSVAFVPPALNNNDKLPALLSSSVVSTTPPAAAPAIVVNMDLSVDEARIVAAIRRQQQSQAATASSLTSARSPAGPPMTYSI